MAGKSIVATDEELVFEVLAARCPPTFTDEELVFEVLAARCPPTFTDDVRLVHS